MNLIKQRVRSPKAMEGAEQGKYVFAVDIRLTKPQIKKLCEEHFGVEIQSVNTHIKPVKKKRVGFQQGSKPLYKQALITLKKGQRIFVKDENQDNKKTSIAPGLKKGKRRVVKDKKQDNKKTSTAQ